MEPQPRVRLVRAGALADSAPYSHAAMTPPGASLVFTAGACPLDAAGETVGRGDIAAQAEQVMDNLLVALRAAGADFRDVVKTTIYVASDRRQDLVTVWEVYRRHLGAHDAPSTLLGVSVLGYPDQLVDVEAVAARG